MTLLSNGGIRACRRSVSRSNEPLHAAHARSEALTLVTNNQREFERVAGLRTTRWV